MDDMDFDDEGENTDDDSENEDKDVSFDEKEFARMMREMMGMPSEEPDEVVDGQSAGAASQPIKDSRIEEVDTSDEGDGVGEASEMKKVMEKLEAELNEAGALNLDPTPRKLAALKGKARAGGGEEGGKNQDMEDESDDEEIDIDFNLAKNLLESFKSRRCWGEPFSYFKQSHDLFSRGNVLILPKHSLSSNY